HGSSCRCLSLKNVMFSIPGSVQLSQGLRSGATEEVSVAGVDPFHPEMRLTICARVAIGVGFEGCRSDTFPPQRSAAIRVFQELRRPGCLQGTAVIHAN